MKKLNMPNIRALLPQPKPRKPRTRLQASASRLTQPVYDDYEEEPTTKLSTAFVVVLVPMLKTEAVGVVLFQRVAPVALAAVVFNTTYSVFASAEQYVSQSAVVSLRLTIINSGTTPKLCA